MASSIAPPPLLAAMERKAMLDTELVEAVARAIWAENEVWVLPVSDRKDWNDKRDTVDEPTKDVFRRQARAALSVARPIIERELLEAMMKDAKLLQILNVQRFLNQHARERGIELEGPQSES